MFALHIEAASEELLGFEAVIHVDRGVQVEENQLEMRGSPVPFSNKSPMLPPPIAAASDEAELAGMAAAAAAGSSNSSSSSSINHLGLRPSPPPRRSDGASPWPLEELEGEEEDDDDDDDDDEDGHGMEEEAGAGGGGGGGGGDDTGAGSSRSSAPLELAQATFLSGHSNSNELLAGSIGFYRYAHPTGAFGLRPPPLRSNVVCIMAVPSWLSSSDLIRFIGGYTRYVRQMRLLRDASMSHRHMLLLQFGSPAIAERFRADYHAKRFNSLEPEVAAPVHVAQVVFAPPRPAVEAASSSRALPAPSGAAAAPSVHLWTGAHRKRPTFHVDPSRPPPPLQPPSDEASAALARAQRGRRAALPPLPDDALLGTAVELPSCPVCLERLDPSIAGIVTIVCDHTFHCECLRRWSDSSCPVCRHVADDSQSTTACEVCGSTDGLWICLVCGHVGCGRYSGCTASVHHNEATEHNFAMELSTQRVWDYKGDNYVHRLIQNKVDGKLVELPDAQQGKVGASGSSAADGGAREMDEHTRELKQRGQEEQYEAVVHEYSLLLTGQLEVQRRHYEERLADIDRAHRRHLYDLEQEIAAREGSLRHQQEAVERESRASAKRLQNAQSAVKERDFNKDLNEQLMRNQGDLREKLAAATRREEELQRQIADMEEQQKELIFHFESQLKIVQEGGGSELGGGSVAGISEPPPPARAGSAKRKGKKG